MPEFAIEITDLTKTYAASGRTPAKEALRSVTLAIPRGAFFGLLGPNGAGKSTLINILAGLVIKTSGTARVCGHDIETDMLLKALRGGLSVREVAVARFPRGGSATDFHRVRHGLLILKTILRERFAP